MERALVDSSPEVRSNGAFGIGLVIENSTEDLSGRYLEVLNKLQPFFVISDAPTDVELNGRDNAAGAVSRIILKNMTALPLDSVLPVLFGALPIKRDFLENRPVFRAIFHIFQSNPDYAMNYFDGLIPTFAFVLDPSNEKDMIGEEARGGLLSLMKAVEVKIPGKVSGTILAPFI